MNSHSFRTRRSADSPLDLLCNFLECCLKDPVQGCVILLGLAAWGATTYAGTRWYCWDVLDDVVNAVLEVVPYPGDSANTPRTVYDPETKVSHQVCSFVGGPPSATVSFADAQLALNRDAAVVYDSEKAALEAVKGWMSLNATQLGQFQRLLDGGDARFNHFSPRQYHNRDVLIDGDARPVAVADGEANGQACYNGQVLVFLAIQALISPRDECMQDNFPYVGLGILAVAGVLYCIYSNSTEDGHDHLRQPLIRNKQRIEGDPESGRDAAPDADPAPGAAPAQGAAPS